MKAGKKTLYLLLIIPVVLFVAGIIISVSYEEAVIRILKKYLDKHLTTEIEVSRIDFSVFKKFPNATVEFRNVMARSGVNFDPVDFSHNTDTLLTARSVFFEFSLLHILRGDYKLKNILLSNGEINLLIDRAGRTNFSVWESDKTDDQEGINISLQSIILLNTRIKYHDLSNSISLDSETERLQIKADFKENNSYIAAKGDLDIDGLKMGDSFSLPVSQIKVDIGLDITRDAYIFKESSIGSGKMSVRFKGEVKRYKANTVFLSFTCNKANVNELIKFFPQQLGEINKEYQVTGQVDFNGTLKGTLSKSNNPLLNIAFAINNGTITNRQNRKRLSGIILKGDYTNGAKRKQVSSILNINHFKANQDKSDFNGTVKITGFNPSFIELTLKSEIEADEFFKFLNIDTLELVSGTIASDIHVKGNITSFKSPEKEEMIALFKEGTLELNDFSFRLKGSELAFTKTFGSMVLGDIIKLRNITFNLIQNDFKIDGNLSNLPEYLFYKDILYAEINFKSDFVDLKSIIESNKSDTSGKAPLFPERIYFKSNFTVQNFEYGKFSAANLSGFISYRPGEFNFEHFSLESVEGLVTGSAIVVQDIKKHIGITCFTELKGVNIQKLFDAMNNFSQHVIVEKNLKGKLSGTLDFSATWDEKFQLTDNSVLANSNLEIKDGMLINFDPMLGLSKYIDANELKEIKFSTLKNQIYIKDKVITIPEMDIHSSAFNIRGMGIHRFDNSYEYLIQVELSELLARRARKKRVEIEEFGTVQDDGLGRLNLPIKISGKGSVYEVHLDRRKAMDGFRKSLSNEKRELENIFNSEKSVNNEKKESYPTNKELIFEWEEGNEKKDFKFEKKEVKDIEQPKFIIEWDDDTDAEKRDTSLNESVN